MIPCKLLPIKKSYPKDQESKTKYGLYLSSAYPIKGRGVTSWIVAVNIDVDYEQHLQKGLSEEDLVLKCVEFLNRPPESKYGKRRKRKPLYGTFAKTPYSYKLKEKNNKKFIQALLITNEIKNKNFWGKGTKRR